jgi:Na+/proline symporter
VLNSEVQLMEAWRSVEPGRLSLFSSSSSLWEQLDEWAVAIVGSVVAQEVAARVLATKSPGVAVRSTYYGALLYAAFGAIPAFLGLIGPVLLPELGQDVFLLKLVKLQLSGALQVLFMGALVSAVLSTVDSTLLAGAAIVERNLLASVWPALSDRQRLLSARLTVVVLGLVAFAFAAFVQDARRLIGYANGFGSSGIFTLLTFGLFSELGSARAAQVSLVLGTLTWVALKFFAFSAPYVVATLVSLGAFLIVATMRRSAQRSAAHDLLMESR